MYGGSQSYLPLKVNQAGMIPLIFAISVLLFPQFLAQIVVIAIGLGIGGTFIGDGLAMRILSCRGDRRGRRRGPGKVSILHTFFVLLPTALAGDTAGSE